MKKDRIELCNLISDKVLEYCNRNNIRYTEEMLYIGTIIVSSTVDCIAEEGIENELKRNN